MWIYLLRGFTQNEYQIINMYIIWYIMSVYIYIYTNYLLINQRQDCP
jgi:hypothetical protein